MRETQQGVLGERERDGRTERAGEGTQAGVFL